MRASGYVPEFTPPSRNTPSRQMWFIVLLCVVLPPVGLVLLWTRATNPLRGKLIVSIIALLSLTLMLTWYLIVYRSNNYTPIATPGFAPSADHVDDTAQTQSTTGEFVPEGQSTDATPIPANPNR